MLHDEYLKQLRDLNPGRVTLPQGVAALLAEVKRRRLFKEPTRLQRLAHIWAEVVGEDIADVSQVTSATHGELRITVSSQALVHELGHFRHDELVERINQSLENKDRVARLSIRSGRIKRQG